jgi:hypothetical protein
MSKAFESKEKQSQSNIYWHKQTEKILKDWSELSSCYRYLHDKSFARFKSKNLWFTLPVIILTTLTGTANFSQSSFKDTSIFEWLPSIIGGVNLLAGMITTISQTLKYATLEEGHRISSMSFGKLARNIKVELNLPLKDRSTSGTEFLTTVKNELDRLLEQSPQIPSDIVKTFANNKRFKKLYKPEIIDINCVEIYDDRDKVADMIGKTAKDLKDGMEDSKNIINDFNKDKELINKELEDLVSQGTTKKGKQLFENKFSNILDGKQSISIDIKDHISPKPISKNDIENELTKTV